MIECYAAFQKTCNYRGKFPEFVHGRGGTNFDYEYSIEGLNKSYQKEFANVIRVSYDNNKKIIFINYKSIKLENRNRRIFNSQLS